MTILARPALIACAAASACAAGTIALRIAVHFWPAFAVISRTTSRTNASNSGWPGAASGPSTQELIESVSLMKRTEFATIAGCVRSFCAVLAEPVNDTTSWQVRCSNASPRLPQTSCSAPSGRMPDSTMRRTTSSVR